MKLRLLKRFRGREAGEVHDFPEPQASKMVSSGIGSVDLEPRPGDNDSAKTRKGKAK